MKSYVIVDNVEFQINTGADEDQGDPIVSVLFDGGFIVTWGS